MCPRHSRRRSYFYPRPPRGGRLSMWSVCCRRWRISIHALREEGDDEGKNQATDDNKFLSTPSARRATQAGRNGRNRGGFLSTPSARRATGHRACVAAGTRDFYPRPPRGGRPSYCRHLRWRASNFYPRPPRGGRPQLWHLPALRCGNFYPRPPRGGRRCRWTALSGLRPISIHALREEGDQKFIDRQSAN